MSSPIIGNEMDKFGKSMEFPITFCRALIFSKLLIVPDDEFVNATLASNGEGILLVEVEQNSHFLERLKRERCVILFMEYAIDKETRSFSIRVDRQWGSYKLIMPRTVIDQHSLESTYLMYWQYHLAEDNAQRYEQCNGYDHNPNEGITQAYARVFVCLAENVGSNQLHFKRLQKLKEFKAALSYSFEQSLTRVELAKEQIKKKKINSPSRLEEPSLSCNLWCQEQLNQMRFEKSNILLKNIRICRGDVYDSDLNWRRSI